MRLEFCGGVDLLALAGRAIAGRETAGGLDATDVARWLAMDRPRRVRLLVDGGLPPLTAERVDAAVGKAYFDGAMAARAREEPTGHRAAR